MLGNTLPLWFEITSLSVLSLILVADLLIVYHRPHVPSLKESALWVLFYCALALLFAGVLFWVGDPKYAVEFVAGWLTEYSLSLDNLFVFVIIMGRFMVPRKYQQEVLMVGIVVALVLRGIFILLGAQLIESFSWIFYLFGAFLIYTSIRQIVSSDDDGAGTEDGWFTSLLKRRLPFSPEFDGSKIRTVHEGRRVFTPMLIVFVAIGTTDLLFALDSIPAIFGITQSPFIVFSANIFALMGLRQLYFLLGGLIEKLEYLKYGIGAILAFIGVKLVFHAMHSNEVSFINGGHGIEWAPEIGTGTSLAFIVLAMAVATIASVIKLRIDDAARDRAELAAAAADTVRADTELADTEQRADDRRQ